MRVSNVKQPVINKVYDQLGALKEGDVIHQHSRLLDQGKGFALACLMKNKIDLTNKVIQLPYDFRTIMLACVTILSVYATGFAFAQTSTAKKLSNPLPNSIKDLENKTSKWGMFAATVCILSVVSAYFDAKRDHCRLNKKNENRPY